MKKGIDISEIGYCIWYPIFTVMSISLCASVVYNKLERAVKSIQKAVKEAELICFFFIRVTYHLGQLAWTSCYLYGISSYPYEEVLY